MNQAKRSRPYRGDKQWMTCQHICTDIKQRFGYFWNDCVTHAAILKWRTDNVFETDGYKHLTQINQGAVGQCFEDFVNILQDKLFWSHVLPGEPHRYLSRTDVDEPVYGPRISEVVDGRGAHCYVCRILKDDTVVFPRVIIPWDEEQLRLDMEAGLVTQEMLDIIRNPYQQGRGYTVRRYEPGYWMNGRIYLKYDVAETTF